MKIKLEDLTPYQNNMHIIDNYQINKLAEAIQEVGYRDRIEVDENFVILCGHARYYALKMLGEEYADVVIHEGMSEEDKIGYRIANNEAFSAESLELTPEPVKEFEEKDIEVEGEVEDEIEIEKDTVEKYECRDCGHRW